MAVYEWRGIDNVGKKTKGVRDADNPKALRLILRRDGILVTEILGEAEARKKKAREVDFGKFLRRISAADVSMVTRQLATLLRSGIPLVEALTALIDQLDQPELKNAFTQTRDRVNEGASFADALKAHPKIFSTLYVNMVAAGEASGTLEVVLQRLAEFLDAQAKLRAKVSAALFYPGFMLCIGVVVIFILMVVVVPKVSSIYNDFQRSLPFYTEVLIFVSNVFQSFWWLMILLALGGAYFFRRWVATEAGRLAWDQKLLKAPLLGRLLTMIAVSRFSRTLAMLLASGVPVLTAMDITRRVLGNTELMRVVEEARASVREGESIAEPLKRSGRFPPIVTHMIAIGERSGQLEEMLEHVANAYDNQVENRVQSLTALLEPAIIVFMGIFAGGIAFAILTPLLQINEFIE